MLDILSGWDGSHDQDSIAASVFTRWYIFFQNSLFHQYTDDERTRFAI